MKITMLFKHLPFFQDVCHAMKLNKQAYCRQKGYGFYEDTVPPRSDAHWSFCYPDAILRLLKSKEDTSDWIFHSMPIYMFLNLDYEFVPVSVLEDQKKNMILPLFYMVNPDAQYYFTNLRGDIQMIPSMDPRPLVSFSGAMFRKCDESIAFLETIVNDQRFTEGVFKDEVSSFLSCEALTIYYMGYPEYREQIHAVNMNDHTALPKYGYPRHLRDIGDAMQPYDETTNDKPILFVTGCGLKPESAMDIIGKHEQFVHKDIT